MAPGAEDKELTSKAVYLLYKGYELAGILRKSGCKRTACVGNLFCIAEMAE